MLFILLSSTEKVEILLLRQVHLYRISDAFMVRSNPSRDNFRTTAKNSKLPFMINMETSKKELKLFFYSIAHFEDKISIIDTVNIFIEYC